MYARARICAYQCVNIGNMGWGGLLTHAHLRDSRKNKNKSEPLVTVVSYKNTDFVRVTKLTLN